MQKEAVKQAKVLLFRSKIKVLAIIILSIKVSIIITKKYLENFQYCSFKISKLKLSFSIRNEENNKGYVDKVQLLIDST